MLETICEVFKEGYKRGWISARDGNASIRHRDQKHFFITPSGVRKQYLQPEMFKKIHIESDYFGQPPTMTHTWHEVEYTAISSGLKPSGEIPLHFELQKELSPRTEIRVVLHMHPTYTVAAMYKGIDLTKLVSEFPELGRYTSVAPTVPEVAPISQELANATVKNLELYKGLIKYDIVGIDRHGVVSIDSSPWRAFEHIERLEHICKIILA
jgi:L-fuculose-phosphate aldolase